jgi:hypothetical protein
MPVKPTPVLHCFPTCREPQARSDGDGRLRAGERTEKASSEPERDQLFRGRQPEGRAVEDHGRHLIGQHPRDTDHIGRMQAPARDQIVGPHSKDQEVGGEIERNPKPPETAKPAQKLSYKGELFFWSRMQAAAQPTMPK